MVEGGRFELPNPKERIYSPPRLATSLPLQGNGAGERSRTLDLLITSQLLYQLSYTGKLLWWVGTESNCRHLELQSNALPTELPTHNNEYFIKENGGSDGTRTRDLLRDRQAF